MLKTGLEVIKRMHDTTGSVYICLCPSRVSIVYDDTTGLAGVVLVEHQDHKIHVLVTSINQS